MDRRGNATQLQLRVSNNIHGLDLSWYEIVDVSCNIYVLKYCEQQYSITIK